MKTNSRKKLLVSSVAMLLVAMLALGTATFAWFSTSTTAKANNIKVQTIQASNLLIRKGTDGTTTSTDWATQIDYESDGNVTLEPASSNDLTKFVKALAPSYNSTGVKEGSVEILTDTNISSYVRQQEFQLFYKADSEAEALNVDWGLTITPNASNDDDFIRVAIVDGDGNEVFTYGKTADDQPYAVSGSAASNTHDKSETDTTQVANASNVSTTAKSGQLVTFNANDIKTYKLIVWYEGTDPQCIDENAVTLNNISLTFQKRATA